MYFVYMKKTKWLLESSLLNSEISSTFYVFNIIGVRGKYFEMFLSPFSSTFSKFYYMCNLLFSKLNHLDLGTKMNF